VKQPFKNSSYYWVTQLKNALNVNFKFIPNGWGINSLDELMEGDDSLFSKLITVEEFVERFKKSTIDPLPEGLFDKDLISLAKLYPHYIQSAYYNTTNISTLLNEVLWDEATPTRKEAFMSLEAMTYTYGEGMGVRTYESQPFHPDVKKIMDNLNNTGFEANVCFLNCYVNEKQHLGWHSDDSPEIDQNYGISVVSFGAERKIYFKEKGFKGELPETQKISLNNGSLFHMPAGFQEKFLHKIPKHDSPCDPRVSLTFRKFKLKI
jgi:alkylated DNA repair dioxygenase AlkB